MKKVLIIGCPGAGKSTFGKRLADKTGLPLYHLDMIWHKPDKTNISTDEFDSRLTEITLRDEWIIDGNYQRTLEMRLNRCDTVFLLDFPLEVCLAGIKSRIGTVREDLPCKETELDKSFEEFVINFPEDNLPKIYRLLEKYTMSKDIHILRSRAEADSYLEEKTIL